MESRNLQSASRRFSVYQRCLQVPELTFQTDYFFPFGKILLKEPVALLPLIAVEAGKDNADGKEDAQDD